MPTAPATITFAHANPDRAATILAALRIHRFHADGHGPATAPLRMFTRYRVPDVTTTICSGLGTLIRRLDRSSVFTVRQNLCGEFAGQQRISDPDLGDFFSALEEHGDELITARELRHGIDTARLIAAASTPVAALAELDRLTGGPWHRQIALLRAKGGSHLDALTT